MDYHAYHQLLTHTAATRRLRLRSGHAALLLRFIDRAFRTQELTSRAVTEEQPGDYLRELAYVPEADELPAGATEPGPPEAGVLNRRYLTR